MTNFSVLISIYCKENPVYFEKSLASLVHQTLVPDEIVLIKDGPLTEDLEKVLKEYVLHYPNLFKIIALPVNKGLGNALSIGILECSSELIARMDTDDICVLNRFEKQINFIDNNPGIDLVGSNVEEFNNHPGDLQRFRKMPEQGNELLKYSKYRSPVNHPSIMFRRQKVIDAGNYTSDILMMEDFSLFVRMLNMGCVFYNIQEVLLNFRVGVDLEVIKRRSGLIYFKNEWKFAKLALKIGHLNFYEWLFYIIFKLPLRLMPPQVIQFVYNTFLRH